MVPEYKPFLVETVTSLIKVGYHFCFIIILHAFLILLLLTIQFNGLVKSEIHIKLMTGIDAICVVNGNQYQPDVSKPTLDQRRAPVINPCPPPLLWIEVKILFTYLQNYAIIS